MLVVGRKTFIFHVVNLCAILGLLLWLHLLGGRIIGVSWLLIIAIPPLLTTPVIKLGDGRLRVFRLLPLPRNTNVPLTDIHKVVLETKGMQTLELHLENGKVVRHHINAIGIDTTKLGIALRNAGVVVEGVKDISHLSHTK